jgi:hypothetical protein
MLISDDGHAFPEWAPGWLKEQVENPDCTGGTHPRLRYLAKWLVVYLREHEGAAERWLRYAAARCDRTIDDGEVARLLAWAEARFGGNGTDDTAKRVPSGLANSNPHPPERDHDEIFSIAERGPRLVEYRESSPVRLSGTPKRDTERVLRAWADYAREPDPWVCFGAADRFWTRRLSDCGSVLSWHEQIVPTPMTGQNGLTADGHRSEHALSAVGDRMFLVVEFDFTRLTSNGKPTSWGPLLDRCEAAGITVLDLNAALISHLSHQRRLWMIVFSGNKSLQAWFPCRGEPEASLRRWFNDHARPLGACPSTWGKSQFVRMPDGTRAMNSEGRQPRQTIEFFDPEAL